MFRDFGADAIFLANTSFQDADLTYFSGLGDIAHSVLLLFQRSKVLFVGEMELERAKKTSTIRDIRPSKDPIKDAVSELSQRKVRKLAVNKRFLPVSVAEKLPFSLVDCSEALFSLRSVKSKLEVSWIKRAAKISLASFETVSFSGSERNIAASLDFELNSRAELSFRTIVAGDSHSSMPHHSPCSSCPKALVLSDFGARFRNYCSDITRMHYLRKKPEFERIHSIVQQAQDIARDTVRPGVKAKDVDLVVRSFFRSKGLEKYFIHSTGHGFGVAIHEAPFLSSNSRDILKKGMVFTIEPGLYLKRFGCRIEDDFVVTRSGCKRLT